MEQLFSPRTRLQDMDSRFHHPELLQELNLNVSTEELLSAERAFTYADLYAMLGNGDTVAQLTPHAAVVRACRTAMRYWKLLGESYRLCFSADGKEDIMALARSPEHLLEICDVVLRLLTVSVVQSVRLNYWSSLYGTFFNAPTLAYLMEQCQSLKCLSLHNLEMDENHCRVLGAYSRPGLEIVLVCCKITSAGASALAEVLGRSQGPTKLDSCFIDNSVLADGLRGNSRMKYLRPRLSGNGDVGNRGVLAIADALRENKGLVNLDLLHTFTMTDEMWDAVCDCLKTHPTLQVLSLQSEWALPPTDLKPRVQALVDMMKVNTSIHTIHLDACYSEHELYRRSVIPFLETNRFRPRLLAIQKTRLITYRSKVLERALLAVRTDLNRFWMLLSGNVEVAFASTIATTIVAAAVNLPAPATNAHTSTATKCCSFCCYCFQWCCTC
jgi:hypothetical protein